MKTNKNIVVKKAVIPEGSHCSGFTLIELLVVVLIIGLLAAVALPQYQFAVTKSRYATLKHLVNNLVKAEEVYHLSNGEYTSNFEKLDINMPEDKLNTSTQNQYNYNWGECVLLVIKTDAFARCTNTQVGMSIQSYFLHTPHSEKGKSLCISHNTDINSISNKICKQETNNKSSYITGNWYVWRY